MFFLSDKGESVWESSTASTKRYKVTNDVAAQVESDGKKRFMDVRTANGYQ